MHEHDPLWDRYPFKEQDQFGDGFDYWKTQLSPPLLQEDILPSPIKRGKATDHPDMMMYLLFVVILGIVGILAIVLYVYNKINTTILSSMGGIVVLFIFLLYLYLFIKYKVQEVSIIMSLSGLIIFVILLITAGIMWGTGGIHRKK